MKVTSTKFFLFLSLLLSVGYSHSSTLESQSNACSSSLGTLDGLTITGLYSKKDNHEFIFEPIAAGTGRENGTPDFSEIEREENEVSSSRKFFEASNCFTVLFDAAISGHFLGFINRSLSICKHTLSISSTGLHLAFQVFRI